MLQEHKVYSNNTWIWWTIRKGETEEENATNVREYLRPGQPSLLLLFLAHLRTSNIPKMPNRTWVFLSLSQTQYKDLKGSRLAWFEENLSNIDIHNIDYIQVYPHEKHQYETEASTQLNCESAESGLADQNDAFNASTESTLHVSWFRDPASLLPSGLHNCFPKAVDEGVCLLRWGEKQKENEKQTDYAWISIQLHGHQNVKNTMKCSDSKTYQNSSHMSGCRRKRSYAIKWDTINAYQGCQWCEMMSVANTFEFHCSWIFRSQLESAASTETAASSTSPIPRAKQCKEKQQAVALAGINEVYGCRYHTSLGISGTPEEKLLLDKESYDFLSVDTGWLARTWRNRGNHQFEQKVSKRIMPIMQSKR